MVPTLNDETTNIPCTAARPVCRAREVVSGKYCRRSPRGAAQAHPGRIKNGPELSRGRVATLTQIMPLIPKRPVNVACRRDA
jgi:hypothetical protein